MMYEAITFQMICCELFFISFNEVFNLFRLNFLFQPQRPFNNVHTFTNDDKCAKTENQLLFLKVLGYIERMLYVA